MRFSRNDNRNGVDKMQDHFVSRVLSKHVRRIISFVGDVGSLRSQVAQVPASPQYFADDTTNSDVRRNDTASSVRNDTTSLMLCLTKY